jgi:hypothetical protein
MSDSQTPAAFAAPDPAELAPLFPGYEIQGLIATGGMGAVYHAVQKSLDRAVAIKILPRELTGDESFRDSFETEAKAMARLNHPNLIGVYDFGEIEGMLYIIMEYVPGNSLFHSAHGTAIDPAEVVRLVSGICQGLAHAHQHGILHRDIKPSNILLDFNAEPKIGDFGLARPIERKTQAGEEIFGTPHYTAPEVIHSPFTVDHRADIFSVGVLLHELLTGRLPADDPRSPSLIAHCDPRFDVIVRRATDPSPEHRYHSALEMVRELQTISTTPGPRILRTLPVSPATVPAGGKPHRKRKSSAALAVFLILAAITAAFVLRHFSRNHADPPPAHAAPPVAAEPAAGVTAEPAPPVETPPAPPLAEPTPEVPPPTVEEPQPAPVAGTTTSSQPKFNVGEFLATRAVPAMRKQAAGAIQARDKGLAANLSAYERALRKLAREAVSQQRRELAEQAIQLHVATCIKNQRRVPQEMSLRLSQLIPGSDLTHEQFLKRQETIESSFFQNVQALAPTYILGIQKQIQRLAADDDPVAIEMFEQEIHKVREDPGHFVSLILGSSPDQ